MARRVTKNGISHGLLLALLGSLLLHLAVLAGTPMKRSAGKYSPFAIEARLIPAVPSAAPDAAPAPAFFATSKSWALPVPDSHATLEAAAPAQAESHAETLPRESSAVDGRAAGVDPTYFPSEQLDEAPRLLGDIRQVYPARARNAGIEGFVTLSLLINERGEVDEINVVKSQPVGFFEDAAIAMLRGQRFTPATKRGEVVKSLWQKTVRFKLQG